jgi:phage/plasmid-associated DNA primase
VASHPGLDDRRLSRLAEQRLVRPKVVVDATSEYFAAQDIIGRWLTERCILDPQLEEKPGRLVADCRTWSGENGEIPPTPLSSAARSNGRMASDT